MIAAIVARWEFEGLSIGIRRKDTPTITPNSNMAHVPAVRGPCTLSDELHEGSIRVEYDAIISHILMPWEGYQMIILNIDTVQCALTSMRAKIEVINIRCSLKERYDVGMTGGGAGAWPPLMGVAEFDMFDIATADSPCVYWERMAR
jgi:hypothetical protein